MESKFSLSDAAYINQPGSSKLEGQAFFQTRGGQPRTCAGTKVSIYPVTQYAKERIVAIYGNDNKGFNSAFSGKKVKFSDTDPQYLEHSRSAVCDAQGNFEFDSLSAGSYYVIASITWIVDNAFITEGGALMEKVSLEAGETKRVILSP